MEKKKMTNKKKFWIGMSSLAAIGAITATVAYFSSVHRFAPDELTGVGYNVTATKILDAEDAANMSGNRTIDATVNVKNEGDGPILSRITYYFESSLLDGGGPLAIALDDAMWENSGWSFGTDGNYKFLKGDDNSYYYQGVLKTNEEATHLTSIAYNGKQAELNGTEVTEGNKKTITYTMAGNKLTITVVVETVQATDRSGDNLDANALASVNDASAFKVLWNNLGKETPASPAM